MDMNEQNIEQIVKQVLSQMSGTAARKAPAANSDIPKTARVAMLTKLENFDIKGIPDSRARRRRYSCQGRRLRCLRHRRS